MTSIPLYYFKRSLNKCNFGDELNTVIPTKLFNAEIIHTSKAECEAIFIGSILTSFLKHFKNQTTNTLNVWGTGFIQTPPLEASISRNLKVYAVRGKKTLKDLERVKQTKYMDVCFGDPGLLLSCCYKDLDFTKKYEYGIIPHYVDQNTEYLKKIHLPNSITIDIGNDVETIIKQIISCKYILSSAMHGLIAADSFGIPNRRFIASYELMGGEYKFDDYYSAFDIISPEAIDLRKIKELNKVDFMYEVNKDKLLKIQDNLIRSFPYESKCSSSCI